MYSGTSTSVCTVGPLLVCVQWDAYMHASSFARVKTLIGFEPEEMMGLHAYDFFHPSDFKACQPNSERAIKCRLTCELCSYHVVLVWVAVDEGCLSLCVHSGNVCTEGGSVWGRESEGD